MTAASLLRGLGAVVVAAVVVAGGIATGCNPQLESTAQGCHINSDCNSPLICVSGACKEECTSNLGCPFGETCVLSEAGNVCALPESGEAGADAGDGQGGGDGDGDATAAAGG